MKLTDFETLTFDCYGTLIDWESGMMVALGPLLARAGGPLTRDGVLEAHAYHESTQQAATPAMPYRDLLAIVYRRLAEEWRVPVSRAECEAYGTSVGSWQPFPDTVEALRYLKRHYRLAVLSNVDEASFARTNALLQVEFDAVCTAEAIGSYKPARANFDYLLRRLERLGVPRDGILHTAQSLFHDHKPAQEVGLATCWIDRRHDQAGHGATMDPGEVGRPDFRFTSMGALVEAHRAAMAD